MMWKKCTLYKNLYGKDSLNNEIPVGEEVVLSKKCRFTPWTSEEIALEGRDVTRNEQRYAFPIPIEVFSDCDKAKIEGIGMAEIKEIIDLAPRWTMIRVKVYKGVIG